MGPAPNATRRNLENWPATLLVTKRRSSPELTSRSRSLWFQVLSTRIVWRPGETGNEISSPNKSSALRSPSSKTNICRVCTSSGESRVTVTCAVIAGDCKEFSLGMGTGPSGKIAGSTPPRRITSGKYGVRQIGNIVAGNVAPESLEIVVAAGLFAENVHDEAAEIEQRPVVRAAAFAMFRPAFQFLVKLLFHFRANRLHLRCAETGAHHEVFSESANFTEIEHGDGRSFFVLHSLDDEANRLRKIRQIQEYRPCL